MLLSTSRFEAAGLVVLEALACGCPVVGPRVGGIPEMLAEGRWGSLYDPGTPPPEVASLVKWLQPGDLRSAYLSRGSSGVAPGVRSPRHDRPSGRGILTRRPEPGRTRLQAVEPSPSA